MGATLEERLARIEREVRWWRRVAVAIAAAALALVAVRALERDAAAEPKGSISSVRAEAFELVDAKGARTAALVNSEGGPHLLLLGTKGQALMDVGVENDGPQIVQFTPEGKNRVVITIGSNGLPRIQLNDAKDDPRVLLAAEPSGGAAMAILGPGKTVRALVATDADGTPHFETRDKDQKAVWVAPTK